MPCGCKNKAGLTPNSMKLVRTNPRPDETGTIMLRTAPKCVEPYSGPFRKTTVFVVGYGTEGERLFTRAQRNEAIAYAREDKRTFDQVLAGQLCTDAVESLFV